MSTVWECQKAIKVSTNEKSIEIYKMFINEVGNRRWQWGWGKQTQPPTVQNIKSDLAEVETRSKEDIKGLQVSELEATLSELESRQKGRTCVACKGGVWIMLTRRIVTINHSERSHPRLLPLAHIQLQQSTGHTTLRQTQKPVRIHG